MHISVPRDINDLTNALDGLGRLITAKRWERAAIVYAWTEPGERGGDKRSAAASTSVSENGLLTINGLASKGIRGLGSWQRVSEYRKAWESACDEVAKTDAALSDGMRALQPGEAIDLPDLPWKDHFGESTPEVQARVARSYIQKHPEVVAEAVKSLPEAADAVAKTASKEIFDAVHRSTVNTATKRDLDKPKDESIIPQSVLRGMANDAISLERRLRDLNDLMAQHPEVIPAIRSLTNMGGGSPDYLTTSLAGLDEALDDTLKVVGGAVPAMKRVSA